jgi:hypothetical protein
MLNCSSFCEWLVLPGCTAAALVCNMTCPAPPAEHASIGRRDPLWEHAMAQRDHKWVLERPVSLQLRVLPKPLADAARDRQSIWFRIASHDKQNTQK